MTSLLDDSRPDALAVLKGLLDLLTHPKASRALLDEMAEATAKHGEAAAAAHKAVAEMKAEREAQAGALAQVLSDHRHEIDEQRQELNREINRRRGEVAAMEKAATAAKQAAETDADQAAGLKQKWQRKYDVLEQASRA
jgi:uncharacterized protein Yka (UPF0111/DUF47 family)